MGYKIVEERLSNGDIVIGKIEVCGKCRRDANECNSVRTRYVYGYYFGHYCDKCFDLVATKEPFDPDYCGERLES
jgi:hypothetical protein